MDPPGERGRLECSAENCIKVEAKCHENSEIKPVGVVSKGKVHSKNDSSENSKFSESSQSTSSHSTFHMRSSSYSPKQTYQLVVRPKIKTDKELLSDEQDQDNIKSHMSSLKGSRYSSNVTKMEKSPLSFNNYEHHSEVPLDDSDHLSLFNKNDRYNRANQANGSHHLVKPSIKHSSFKTSNKSQGLSIGLPDRQRERGLPNRETQSMNQDIDSMKRFNSQGKISSNSQQLPPSTSQQLPPSAVTAAHGDSHTTVPQKHTRLDYKKASYKSSSVLKAQSTDLNCDAPYKHIFSQPTSAGDPRQKQSEISPTNFTKYKINSNKLEHNSHQGTAGLPGKLHKTKSQPNVASATHITKPKSASDLESLKLSFEHRFEPENVKTKVKSVWNNIRFGWTLKSKSSFKYDSPLFMLGKCYHRRKDDPSTEPEDQFIQDFGSRIWLTYRSNFYPIPGTKLNNDCGWGCMLRSGQMLIAQSLVTHFLGRDWRLHNRQTDTDSVFYKEIIRWFSDPLDAPSDKTPFCLHHLANFGRAQNKVPGEWYGPASVAYIFRDAFIKASQSIPVLSQLCLYVAPDCTVYIQDVINLCTKRHKSGSLSHSSECDSEASSSTQVQPEKWQRSLILLIPMRLGGEVINEIYTPCVQSLLSHSNCMGIIGGRPKHSLYFLGWQESKLIYLDPHLCREAVDTTVPDFKIETFHCMTPRKLPINKMDPSCTVGFYIQDENDFKKFVQEVREFISPPKQKGLYPMFIFSDGCQSEMTASQRYASPDRRVRVTHYHVDENGKKTSSGESEEFVML